jgi:uncharacterized circularly permuted ATP-grasp superfamily protein
VLPCTKLTAELVDGDLQDRERWVLKPAFGSGGAGVVIGRFVDRDAWDDALRRTRQGQWIAQMYMPIPRYAVPLSSDDGQASTPLYANWNPFFFGGAAAGGVARVSSAPIVGITAHGALLPTVLVDE